MGLFCPSNHEISGFSWFHCCLSDWSFPQVTFKTSRLDDEVASYQIVNFCLVGIFLSVFHKKMAETSPSHGFLKFLVHRVRKVNSKKDTIFAPASY